MSFPSDKLAAPTWCIREVCARGGAVVERSPTNSKVNGSNPDWGGHPVRWSKAYL